MDRIFYPRSIHTATRSKITWKTSDRARCIDKLKTSAEEIEIISNKMYRQLRAEFNDRGWSKKEPGEQYPKEITHIFEQMIFHALAEQYIGESKAAELMNMPLESFRSLRAMESQDVAHHQ